PDLPPEILNLSFTFLDPYSQKSAGTVCKVWEAVIDNDSTLSINKLRQLAAGKLDFYDDLIQNPDYFSDPQHMLLLVPALLSSGDPLSFALRRSQAIEVVKNSPVLQNKLVEVIQGTAFAAKDFSGLIKDPTNHPQLKKNLAARSLLAGLCTELESDSTSAT